MAERDLEGRVDSLERFREKVSDDLYTRNGMPSLMDQLRRFLANQQYKDEYQDKNNRRDVLWVAVAAVVTPILYDLAKTWLFRH